MEKLNPNSGTAVRVYYLTERGKKLTTIVETFLKCIEDFSDEEKDAAIRGMYNAINNDLERLENEKNGTDTS